MKLRKLAAVLASGIYLGLPLSALANTRNSPEQLRLGDANYVLVDSSLETCPAKANTPGIFVLIKEVSGYWAPGGGGNPSWLIYDSIDDYYANYTYPDPYSDDYAKFLGCYKIENLPAQATSRTLPSNLVDCVADSRFQGMVKHVYQNDSTGIDWVKAFPLTDGSGGIWVEEYMAVPINGRLGTMFHGAYYVFPDNTTRLDWGSVARGVLEHEYAREIVNSWDASYCRRDYL
jgi:hypothetical protein